MHSLRVHEIFIYANDASTSDFKQKIHTHMHMHMHTLDNKKEPAPLTLPKQVTNPKERIGRTGDDDAWLASWHLQRTLYRQIDIFEIQHIIYSTQGQVRLRPLQPSSAASRFSFSLWQEYEVNMKYALKYPSYIQLDDMKWHDMHTNNIHRLCDNPHISYCASAKFPTTRLTAAFGARQLGLNSGPFDLE